MTYRPPYFRIDDPKRLLPLIAAFPLATLATSANDAIALTHLPLLALQEGDALRLQGHVARANGQWKTPASSAVAIFRIADHYMSPTWYATKARDPHIVPTWDYVAIEARGSVRWIDDRHWLADFVRRLTDSQEARIGSNWSVDDAPAEYLESQYGAIVGVEMRVDSLIGTFKLNQNHPRENIESIIAGLEAQATPQALALLPFVRELLS
ncbi:MAG TPA: FMN-binding negative transcriptional regulator [Candidatus Baltobacteraceae bacterium]|nr:FMN-binding negative transcriptional regulator [Candidatus Baltobacteraceae bacterium]